jgi:RNA polymerase sigma-70 factor (ECF subfamily)
MEIEEKSKKWFQEVFDKNYEYIRNYLYYLSGDIKLTEDLTQDVFLILWEKRDTIRNETVRPFLFKMARNAFLRSIRTKKYDLKFKSTYLEQVENESPEYIMEFKEFDKKVQQTIAGLPERCRIIYLMSRIDDLTYPQIADSLNISVKAVEKQVSKALAVFRKKLGVKM